MPYRRRTSRTSRRGGQPANTRRRRRPIRSNRRTPVRRQFRSVAADTASIVQAISKDTRDLLGVTGTAARTASRTLKRGTGLVTRSGKRALQIARTSTRGATRLASAAVGDTTRLANRAVKGSLRLARTATKDVVGLARTAEKGALGLTHEIFQDSSKLGQDALKGSFKLAKGAVRETTYLLDNSVSGTVGFVKGTAKSAAKSVADAVDCGNVIASDFVGALSDVTSGLVDGATTVADTTGKITEQILNDIFDVHATHVFHGVGSLAKQIADALGGAIRRIPYVGKGAGYIVENFGGGVFHVVVEVGKFITRAGVRTGKVAHKASDLVVYTLTAGRNQVTDTRESIDDLLKRLADSVTMRKGKSFRSRGGSRGRRRGTRKQGTLRAVGGTPIGDGDAETPARRPAAQDGAGPVEATAAATYDFPWYEATDTNTGKPYYYNASGENTWIRPGDVPIKTATGVYDKDTSPWPAAPTEAGPVGRHKD